MLPLNPPAMVRDVVAACTRAGGRIYLVGGGVRDHLMHRPLKDWDLEVYGLPAATLERVLG
jgi:tRNA nucleotidyltransferase (CCA-adding enzyme)